MAEVGYNSKFEGQEVDSRLEKVVQAAPGTDSESGKGGLIPAPPAGSQDGSKTLLSDMTWGDYVTKQYIDDAVSAAGWMLSYLKFMAKTPNVATTLASLPIDAHNIIANVASATNLSMAVSAEDVGREWQVRVNNTTGTDITQPLPTSGLFQSMSGDSVVVPKNSFIKLSIWYINDKLVIRVGEQA